LIVYLISAMAPTCDVLLRRLISSYRHFANMTTMGWRVKVRFFCLHSGLVFFSLRLPSLLVKIQSAEYREFRQS